MSDTPEQTARRRQLLQEIWDIEEEAGITDLDLTPDEIVAMVKLVRKELAERHHRHEIEVFGAPCDCGTRHEYCGECDWVESCEPEGEQK